jgi:hypothetical protein
MKIDDVIEKIRDGHVPPEHELRALIDYVAYLEFGYAGLERTDMVALAKKSGGQRIADHKGTEPCPCKHEQWDFVNHCQDVRYLHCGHIAKLTGEHRRHRPFAVCEDSVCRQCELEDD